MANSTTFHTTFNKEQLEKFKMLSERYGYSVGDSLRYLIDYCLQKDEIPNAHAKVSHQLKSLRTFDDFFMDADSDSIKALAKHHQRHTDDDIQNYEISEIKSFTNILVPMNVASNPWAVGEKVFIQLAIVGLLNYRYLFQNYIDCNELIDSPHEMSVVGNDYLKRRMKRYSKSNFTYKIKHHDYLWPNSSGETISLLMDVLDPSKPPEPLSNMWVPAAKGAAIDYGSESPVYGYVEDLLIQLSELGVTRKSRFYQGLATVTLSQLFDHKVKKPVLLMQLSSAVIEPLKKQIKNDFKSI